MGIRTNALIRVLLYFSEGVQVGLFLKHIEDMRWTRGWATTNKRRCIVCGDVHQGVQCALEQCMAKLLQAGLCAAGLFCVTDLAVSRSAR
jgi:hypothetical protein